MSKSKNGGKGGSGEVAAKEHFEKGQKRGVKKGVP